jgi:hypothetical protein
MTVHFFKANGTIQRLDGKGFRTIRTRKLRFDCECGAEVCARQDVAPAKVFKRKQTVSCPLCKKFVAHVQGREILSVTAL